MVDPAAAGAMLVIGVLLIIAAIVIGNNAPNFGGPLGPDIQGGCMFALPLLAMFVGGVVCIIVAVLTLAFPHPPAGVPTH